MQALLTTAAEGPEQSQLFLFIVHRDPMLWSVIRPVPSEKNLYEETTLVDHTEHGELLRQK